MALPSRHDADATPIVSRRRGSVRLADAHDQATPSPVLEQQARLHEQWIASADQAAEPGKWSARRTAGFIVLTCGGFWACAAFAIASLLR